ncbi:family 16 glycosylhydrolase [Acuticoccus sediminis]|uniref:family 16 glycosylhydrolase n=1 Tax=Acuticoccus sediminis TaxID=2184697 RepID=UPI001CFF48BE|nr:family 16 glycosylhydrolase [Acuticoccus sediminis]
MRRSILITTLTGLSAALWAAAASPSHADGFFDDFDRLDGKRWFVSNGWTNGDHQNCIWKKAALHVADGQLTLTLKREPTTSGDGKAERDYSCAELQTREVHGYGLYEARIKAAAGSGLNSAFFTFIDKLAHDEIDVEILGRDMSRFDSNYYTDGKGENQEKIAVPSPADETMTDYAFEWTEGRIRWYVNGKLMREVVSDDVPDAKQKVFFSLWNGAKGMSGWLGPRDDTIEERTMTVDHVGFTPIGERCLFPGSLSCSTEWSGW